MAPALPPGRGGSGEYRDIDDVAAYCAALIAPKQRCGHHVHQHLIHGSALLECWRCDDWHHFVPGRLQDFDRDAA